MTAEERGEIRELQRWVERAQSELAGLQEICKILFLRIGQIKVRTNLNGLVEPMDPEIAEILEGLIGAQAAHLKIEEIVLSML